jgi:hypothetical protein
VSDRAVDVRLPWHRETVGHSSVEQIGHKVLHDLLVPLPDGIPPNNKVVAFVGNGPRQTENADLIIRAVEAALTTPTGGDALRVALAAALHDLELLELKPVSLGPELDDSLADCEWQAVFIADHPAVRAALTTPTGEAEGLALRLGRELLATGYVDEHFVTFTETGYGLEHPIRCRPDLNGCVFNEWLATQLAPDREPGRYLMTWPEGPNDGPRYALATQPKPEGDSDE